MDSDDDSEFCSNAEPEIQSADLVHADQFNFQHESNKSDQEYSDKMNLSSFLDLCI